MNTRLKKLPAIAATLLLFAAAAGADELGGAVKTLLAVGPEGAGNVAASAAWKQVAAADAGRLAEVLTALDGANDYAANWLRSAAETIADREKKAGRVLPLAALNTVLQDRHHAPVTRRLAFDLIARAEPDAATRLLPGFLNDPAPELRREAVQQVVDEAARAFAVTNRPVATRLYQQALQSARDATQIGVIANRLKELGQPVNLVKQFGFLTLWQVVGPFHNTNRAGYAEGFAPERAPKLADEYNGLNGRVRWLAYTTTNEFGMVDMNKPFGSLKEATAYALTEFYADSERAVELRLGSKNGWKLWFNGQFLFGRDEYHRMAETDQYRVAVRLQPGRNEILVKVCQNEEKEAWTVEWEFQLRVTDGEGNVIRSSRPPSWLATQEGGRP